MATSRRTHSQNTDHNKFAFIYQWVTGYLQLLILLKVYSIAQFCNESVAGCHDNSISLNLARVCLHTCIYVYGG